MDAQYQADLDKNIQIGDLVRVDSGSKQIDGICRVLDRKEENGYLWLTVKRLIKYNDQIVRNSKVRQDVRVRWSTKLTLEKIIEDRMAELEIWKEHLK